MQRERGLKEEGRESFEGGREGRVLREGEGRSFEGGRDGGVLREGRKRRWGRMGVKRGHGGGKEKEERKFNKGKRKRAGGRAKGGGACDRLHYSPHMPWFTRCNHHQSFSLFLQIIIYLGVYVSNTYRDTAFEGGHTCTDDVMLLQFLP